MFHYDVMSEQDAMNERFQLMKEGIYDAVITASQDTTSANSGNPMMDMTVTVYDENGKTHDVRDFLVFTKQMMWKVVHFAESAGILKEYESGKLCSQTAINRTVQVKIVVEQGSEIPQDKLKGKPLGTRYFDKNKIEDYIKKGDQGASGVPNGDTPPPLIDDDIPFDL
jgi:hypothetical protein